MKNRFPTLVYNSVSLAGAAIAAVNAGLIAFMIVLDFFAKDQKPYIGILTFIILPSFMMCGLILIAYGVYREHKRRLKGISKKWIFPRIDLNDQKHRKTFVTFTIGTLVLLIATTFGSFKAYEYTDSDEFCGLMCHSVMIPEYTAYKNSPHSNVGCAKCHIGSGADWFVKAKISGSYQVYSVIFNKYSRPIPTPIGNLRPAQETCEQCHWPKHFFNEKSVKFYHFLGDEKNTRSSMKMLLKVGGGNPETGITSGIHWHMNIANDVFYYPADETRQVIPYVKMRSKSTGKISEYFVKGFDVSKLDTTKLRKMDCIDCHNRPSHIYNEPHKMVNMHLSIGTIDSTLPYIKSVAVQVLEESFKTKDEGLQRIGTFIRDFYASNYPDLLSKKKEGIDRSITAVKTIFEKNYFPEMNVSWKKFPNNIGHTYYDGCFRCHDGSHFSKAGVKVSNDCNACHTISEQVSPEYGTQVSATGVEFYHPGNLSINIKNQKCSDCHGVKSDRKKHEG